MNIFHARLLARDDQQVIHVSKGDDVHPNLVKFDLAAKERGLEGRRPEAEIDHDTAQVPLPAQACTPQAVQSFVEDEVSRFSTLQGEITQELDHCGLDNVSEQKCRTYVEAPHLHAPFCCSGKDHLERFDARGVARQSQVKGRRPSVGKVFCHEARPDKTRRPLNPA